MTDKKEERNLRICCPIPYISECDKNKIVLLFKVTASTNEQKQKKIQVFVFSYQVSVVGG